MTTTGFSRVSLRLAELDLRHELERAEQLVSADGNTAYTSLSRRKTRVSALRWLVYADSAKRQRPAQGQQHRNQRGWQWLLTRQRIHREIAEIDEVRSIPLNAVGATGNMTSQRILNRPGFCGGCLV